MVDINVKTKKLISMCLSKVRTEAPNTRVVFSTYESQDAQPKTMVLIPGSAEWEDFRYEVADGTDDLDVPTEAMPKTPEGTVAMEIHVEDCDFTEKFGVMWCGEGKKRFYEGDVRAYLDFYGEVEV